MIARDFAGVRSTFTKLFASCTWITSVTEAIVQAVAF